MTTTVGAGTQTDRFATAFVRGRCFLDFMHGTGANDPPWQDSARFELWLTSDRATLFKPFTRALYPDAPRSSLDYWESPYGRVIGWHPDAKIFEGRDEQAKYLDHVFARDQRSSLVLRQEIEESGSYGCVVIESKSKSDQLWLAPRLGFAIVKRILVAGKDDRRKITSRCSDFKEADEGLWLPWGVESHSIETVEGVETPVRDFRIEVRQLSVNDAVRDAILEFKPPPGTVTYDAKENATGFEQGGEDLLDFWGVTCSNVFPPAEISPSRLIIYGSVASTVALIVAMIVSLRVARIRAPARSPLTYGYDESQRAVRRTIGTERSL
ncbi:MAG: hypothetical protein ACLQNE_04260 [Thermoguttaceae bacterium]